MKSAGKDSVRTVHSAVMMTVGHGAHVVDRPGMKFNCQLATGSLDAPQADRITMKCIRSPFSVCGRYTLVSESGQSPRRNQGPPPQIKKPKNLGS